MTIALKSGSTIGGGNDGTNSTTTTITLPVLPTAGSVLILILGSGSASAATVSSVSGGGVTTWVKQNEVTTTSGPTVSIWSGVVGTTPSTSITGTWGTKISSTKWWGYVEVTGVTAFDAGTTVKTATSTTISSNTLATALADEIVIFGFAVTAATGTLGAYGNGFTTIFNDASSQRGGCAYKIETSIQSAESSSITETNSRLWVATIAGWKGTAANTTRYGLAAFMSGSVS